MEQNRVSPTMIAVIALAVIVTMGVLVGISKVSSEAFVSIIGIIVAWLARSPLDPHPAPPSAPNSTVDTVSKVAGVGAGLSILAIVAHGLTGCAPASAPSSETFYRQGLALAAHSLRSANEACATAAERIGDTDLDRAYAVVQRCNERARVAKAALEVAEAAIDSAPDVAPRRVGCAARAVLAALSDMHDVSPQSSAIDDGIRVAQSLATYAPEVCP